MLLVFHDHNFSYHSCVIDEISMAAERVHFLEYNFSFSWRKNINTECEYDFSPNKLFYVVSTASSHESARCEGQLCLFPFFPITPSTEHITVINHNRLFSSNF